MKVRIHREGTNIIFGLLVVLSLFDLFVYNFLRPIWIAWFFIIITLVMFILVVNFYRSPRRHFKGNRNGAVVSSVDGTVVAIEELFEEECLQTTAIQLSVFMSPLNVHANWFPVEGKVTYVKHHSGRFMAAYLPKSSKENERSTVEILSPLGHRVVVRQIAGAMARRIVTYAEQDEEALIDDHLGFIKLGSRVDIYLPLGSDIMVKIGDKVTGCVTQVAKLPDNT